jgi:hypothetical protein
MQLFPLVEVEVALAHLALMVEMARQAVAEDLLLVLQQAELEIHQQLAHLKAITAEMGLHKLVVGVAVALVTKGKTR